MEYFVKLGTLKENIKEKELEKINKKFTRWLFDIRATGKYIISGGLDDGSLGLTILEAESKEDAMNLFSEDPFNELLSSWVIHKWNTIDFSRK